MLNFATLNNPIMLVSDNPALPGGLSRMCRDLATLCCTLPQFRVAVLGRGIGNKRMFPFVLYDFPETCQWGEGYIQNSWENFSEGQPGVIVTLDDQSRRHWFANPTGLPEDLAKFLGTGRNFQKWMYLPLDSTGPNGQTLSLQGLDCVSNYDRVLASSEWGRNVLARGGRTDADWLPHGFWGDKFHPVQNARQLLGWKESDIWIGCVMANQSRKDYPAAFECFAALKKEYGNVLHCWVHTDALIHYWNIPALAAEYGVGECLEVTSGLGDEQLGLRYSGCDVSVLPTAGEGFGYPILESLACGTVCVTTDYAGGSELVEPSCRVHPVTYKVDTMHSVLRAVNSGYGFSEFAKLQIERKHSDPEYWSGKWADSVSHLEWNRLKNLWTKWLLGGLK